MTNSRNKITILNISSTVILQGLAFFSGPIFSSMLGTNNYGIATVYLTWTQLASTVFSLQAASTVAVARSNFPLEDQPKYQSSVLSLASLCYLSFSTATIIIVIVLSKWLEYNMIMIILGLIQGWGMYCVSFMNSKFTYEFKAGGNFILSVSISILTILLSILMIRSFPNDTNYWGRIVAQSSVYGVVGLLLYGIVIHNGKSVYNKQYWKFTLPIAVPTIFHLLANIVLNQSDRIMLQAMVGNSAAGIYGLACTFSTVLSTIYSALNNSWVPFYYEFTRQERINEMKDHARNYIELFTIIAMGFILLARDVFHLYANKSFWEGTDLIPLFSLGYYFVFLYSFPVNYEFYNKRTKTIAIGTTLAAICNIAFNYIGISLFGIKGAVIATAIAHFLQFMFHFICAKRISSSCFPFKMRQFVPGFLAVFITCIIYWFTRELWYIRWVLAIVLGVFILYRIYSRREIF